MKKLRWQLIIIFLSGLTAGILLLSDSSNAPIQVFESQPTQGGIYREALIGNLQRLNPLLSWYNNADQDVCRLIYSGLVTFDSRGAPIRDLATDWIVSQDGSVYNFAINPDAEWHDGQPVTADDVVFTYEMLKQGSGFLPDDLIAFWQKVEIRTLNDHTVQFILGEPFAPFLDYVSIGILPKHIWGNMSFAEMADSKVNIQPVGSGIFSLKALDLDGGSIRGVILGNNANYYGTKAFLEEVQFIYYPDSKSALTAYKQDLVDGISYASMDVLPSVLVEADLSLYSSRLPIQTMIYLNLDNKDVEFFQDVDVRRALLTGLNRPKIINTIFNGQALEAKGPVLDGNWAYYDGLQRVEYDQQKAVELFKTAGFILASEQDQVRSKDGITLNFTLLYPDDDEHRHVAELIQQDWAALNVLVNLEAVEYDELVNQRLESRDYQAALVEINLSDTPDPDPYPFWDQTQITSGQNYSQWNSKVVSQYLETARVTINMTERERLYRNFQVVFADEIPAIPLYNPVYNFPISNKVNGVSVGPLYRTSDRFMNIASWYMNSRSELIEELRESDSQTE